MHLSRSRWAALGAAVAVSLGAGGGFGIASATIGSGERAVFVPITPCRLMDTRVAPDTVGPRTAPLGPAETYSVTVVGASGQCNLPPDATGVVMNVTAVSPTAASFLTVFPAGPKPLASNLNYVAGQAPTPNAVTVDVPASGQVSFYNNAGFVNVVADIVGYYVDHNHDDEYLTPAELAARDLGQIVVGADSFSVVDTSAATQNFGSQLSSQETGVACFLAPAALPQGAVITRLRVRAVDQSATNEDIDVSRVSLTTSDSPSSIAHDSTSGNSSQVRTFVQDTTGVAAVDLTQYRYFASVCFTSPNTFWDVIIKYTLPTP